MAASRRVAVELAATRGHSYEVVIGAGLLGEVGARLAPHLGAGTVFVVSDATVQSLYGDAVVTALSAAGHECVDLVMEPGESAKNRDTVAAMQDLALASGVDRDSRVVALGGGVPGDLGGYVAATLLRGLPWIQVPTSLLAMVDSSVGGKTGIDTPAGKNLVGAFWQPELVLADMDTLKTLPEVELAAGMAEVIKYGVVLEEQLFTDLEDGLLESCLARVPEALAMIVERCVACKAAVVAEDEREMNRRQVLNFGHTVGHGIEVASDYALRHGEAVAIGMVAAARLSERRLGGTGDLADRIADLCVRAGLPTRLPDGVTAQQVVLAARNDKKGARDDLRCVLVGELGRAADDQGNWSHSTTAAEIVGALG
jgi:3-dehydroquinate synthase